MLDVAETGATDTMLARAAGVPPSTFATWKGRTEPGFVAFFDEIERARAVGDRYLLDLVRSAASTDWKAAKYLLSCRHAELSEARIQAREAADRVQEIEKAKIRAAIEIQDEIAAAQAEASDESGVVSTLAPDAQVLAAQIVRMLSNPDGVDTLRTLIEAAR